MNTKTELLLYQLLWIGEQVARPTFRNLTTSFEVWAYSSGLLRTINRLEHQEFLETQGKSLDRVIRLTEKSRKLIIGDRDPSVEWARKWDGKWRMVLFDIPEPKRMLRRELRGILKKHHFGCLQQSVWLSPHPIGSIHKLIRKATPGMASLSLMESHLLPGENNADVVKGAWDYSQINANYETYTQHLNQFCSDLSPAQADHFIAEEKKLWETALKHDPLLPKQLTPYDYKGKQAWRLRQKKLPKMISLIFNP